MTRTKRSRSERAYRALLHLHPAAFRRDYGDQMLDCFRDRLRDERARGGVRAVTRVWARALPDLATTAARGHAERLAQRPAHRSATRPATGDSMLETRALDRGRRIDPGFDVTNVATTALNVGTADYDEGHARTL